MKFDSLLAKMDRLPPCVVRLFARKRCSGGTNSWAPLSHLDISNESGIPGSTVADLSRKRSWSGIRFEVADRFALACGVNLANIDEAIGRLRNHRARLKHLGRGDKNQRRMIAELLAKAKPQ